MSKPKTAKFQLTKEQKDIIFGTLLGDGYLNKRGSNVRLQLTHGPKQYEYIKWKSEKLYNLLTPRGLKYEVYNDKWTKTGKLERWNFYTISHEYLQYLHTLLYSNNGKKLITKESLDRLNSLSLYVWFCDDGNLDKNSRRFRLSTCSTDGIIEDMICKKLYDKFNIICKPILICRNKKDKSIKYYGIHFNRINTIKIIELVNPHIQSHMRYKFDLEKLKLRR